jgi:acyl-CoA reductase-like NAD-dependent aldehyde dehydrogenase
MGNTVVGVPSERHPLAATDFYSVLDTSDVPGGVVNIVTGAKDALARVLAEHDDVDAVWYSGHAGRRGGRGGRVGGEHEAHLGRVGAARLARPPRR